MRLHSVYRGILIVILTLFLAGCGMGGGGSTETSSDDSASSEAGDVEVPEEGGVGTVDETSAVTYGAMEKFNEFSVSFMATMVQNLEETLDDLGASMSKAFYGSVKDIRCGCEANREEAVVRCECVDVDGDRCYGKAARSASARGVVMAGISCGDFNLDADTIFTGSIQGEVSISSFVLGLLGDGYGAFFGDKEIGAEDEIDECRIDERITNICSLTDAECSRQAALVAISLEVLDDGFALYDKCGDMIFGPESAMRARICFRSYTQFLTSFVFKGELNGEETYMKNNIKCNIQGLF